MFFRLSIQCLFDRFHVRNAQLPHLVQEAQEQHPTDSVVSLHIAPVFCLQPKKQRALCSTSVFVSLLTTVAMIFAVIVCIAPGQIFVVCGKIYFFQCHSSRKF